MTKKRTFGFDDFKSKLDENIDSVGFRTYEHEEDIDKLGEGDSLDTSNEIDTQEEPAPIAPSEEPVVKPLDSGNTKIKGQDVINNLNNIINKIKKNEMDLDDIKNVYFESVEVLKKYPDEEK